jgi:hypothetical protein
MDRDRWEEAMQAELQSLQEYGAWSIVGMSAVILTKSLSRIKHDRFKADLGLK